MMEVLNPEKVYEGEAGKEGTVKEPKAPSMPLAASVDITKNTLVKMAKMEKKHGHVCPACGMESCKPLSQSAGSLKYACPACETETTKDIFVSKDDPSKLRMKIAWTLNPEKVYTAKSCTNCEEQVKKFAARIKVATMMKKAQSSDFPMANCIERIARKHGLNAVAHFGPCKGKPLAECVCNQLKKFDMRKVKHLDKLASVYSTKDPMEECIQDHMGKERGYTKSAAVTICKALKKKFATEADANPMLLAFADDSSLNIHDLREMNDRVQDDFSAPIESIEDEGELDIGDPIDGGKETVSVSIEIPKDEAKAIQGQLEEALSEEGSPEVIEGAPEMGSASTLETAENAPIQEEVLVASIKGEKMIKEANKPTKVENIEKDVEAGIPRATATLGKEGPANIDVKEQKPSIPSGKATMGNEGPSNIDVKADLPDIPVDSSFIGGEKDAQKDMPAINNEIKGTVIAEVEFDELGQIVHIAAVPSHVEHLESEVEAGIPRSKATLGKEGPDNIDVALKNPEVPRAKATLGKEGPDNIDVATSKVDVPASDSAYLGVEKQVQNGMPSNSVKELGTMRAERHEEQMKKLAEGRVRKATKVAAMLLSDKRISASEFEEVVEDLSKLDATRIETFAARMYPKATIQKQAASETFMNIPVIQESRSIEPKVEKPLSDKLSSAFTIGTKQLDASLREDGDR